MLESLLYIRPHGQTDLTLRRARVLAIVFLFLTITISSLMLLALGVDAIRLTLAIEPIAVGIAFLAILTIIIVLYLLNRWGHFQLALNIFMFSQSLIPLFVGLQLAKPIPSVFFVPLVVTTAAVFGRPSYALLWAVVGTLVPFVLNLLLYQSWLAPTAPIVLPNSIEIPSIFGLECIALSILWISAGAGFLTSRLLHQLLTQRLEAEAALREAYDGLEQQVASRTAELSQSNFLLQRSEGNQRALLDAIPDLMFRVNQDGVILDFKAEKGPGVTVPWQANVGSTIAQVMPPDLAAQTMALIQRALQTNEVQISEYAIPAHNDIIDGEARVVVSGPNEIVTIIRNITERKNIERLKDEFISTVSHELRTPLTSIRGSLGLIAGGVTGTVSPQVKAMVEIAYNNSERLVRLINDMLDIAKIESGKMTFDLRPLAVIPLVEQALADNASYAAQFGVHLVATYADPDLTVEADSDRLLQVLTNLLSNAAKFSSAGATVDVGVARVAGQVRLTVRDYGAGIPEAFRERIFQKFAQADASNARNKGGTGLGLSITKVIVEKCGGSISFSTETGVGTTFTVDLPEWRPSAIPAAPADVAPVLLAHLPAIDAPPRILHIEDDQGLRQFIATMLAGTAEIQAAATLEAARELLHIEQYNLVILDVALPDGSGLDLLPLLQQHSATPVLLFSGYDMSQAIADQVATVLIKSRTSEHVLLATITTLIEQHQHLIAPTTTSAA